MKISVSFDRKVGLPGYSSVGASCRIEWDADPAAEPIAAQIRAIQDQCERVVAEQLARFGADGGAAPPPPSAPVQPSKPTSDPPASPAAEQLAAVKAKAAALKRSGPTGRGPSRWHPKSGCTTREGLPTPPNCAAHVYPWLRAWEELGLPDMVRRASSWAKAHGYPWRTQDWPAEAVAEFVELIKEDMEAAHV